MKTTSGKTRKMPRFGVTISVEDLYYEIEAADQDEAMDEAFRLAEHALDAGDLYLDCNEVVDLDD